MGVRKYVFASRAERNSYEKLARTWGKSHEIQSNLPFLNVFCLDDLNLNSDDAERLKKTSIDFTLCDKEYRPIMCVEFDGLYDGVNIGHQYFPSRETRGRWRDKIMNLKLLVARESGLPFFVVGAPQFQDLLPELKYTIVDGIVGDVLAHRAMQETFQSGFDPEEHGYSKDEFEELPETEKGELIQDWATSVEVVSELSKNPVRRAAADLSYKLAITRWGVDWKYFPEVHAEAATLERAKEMEAALWVGCEVTLHTEDFGALSETIMLPNFQTLGFGGGIHLSEAIAELVCLVRLAGLRGIQVSESLKSDS
jgi:hypothetical protein